MNGISFPILISIILCEIPDQAGDDIEQAGDDKDGPEMMVMRTHTFAIDPRTAIRRDRHFHMARNHLPVLHLYAEYL